MTGPANKRPRILMLQTSHFHPVSLGMISYGRQVGWGTIFAVMYAQTPRHMVEEWRPDALIVGESDGSEPNAWWRCGVPVAAIDPVRTDLRGVGVVRLDFAAAGRMAAEHFLDAGFRNLAYCWLGDLPALNEQREGFREVGQAGGGEVHVLDWPARTRRYHRRFVLEFRLWLAEQVGKLPKPLGLLVDSDWTGLEAEEAFRDANILVPDQVGIVSCYNMEPLCESARVPLSSVDMNWQAQGYQAAALLDRMMQGDPAPDEPVRIAPKGVVVRTSSDVIAVPHPAVAKAMYMIREHYSDPTLTVRRMAAAAGISTVMLTAAFKNCLGYPPGLGLRQWRLRKAMDQLVTTRRTAKDIAAACGYSGTEHLIDTIKRATGLTPHRWRKQQKAESGNSEALGVRFSGSGKADR